MPGGLDDEIVRLYREGGLSATQVGLRVGWSESFVRSRLVALGVPRRTAWAANAVECDLEDLQRLYVNEGQTLGAIAAHYGCSLTTIWRKLTAAGVQCREGGSGPKYARTDFGGDPAEMAYLVGFRLGDLHVALEGNTVVVKCTSTRSEQVDLFRHLFEAYGHVYTDEATMARRQRQSVGMEARMNRTFDFLLPKEDCVPDWVVESDDTFFAFAAGYIDAEGYIRTYLPRGYRTEKVQLEIRSYDCILLDELGEEFNVRGVGCPPATVRVEAGYTNKYGVRSTGVLWGLGMSRRDSLLRLFERIDPYLRHAKRRRQMMRGWQVLLEGNKHA